MAFRRIARLHPWPWLRLLTGPAWYGFELYWRGSGYQVGVRR